MASILLVDDEKNILLLLKEVLVKMDHDLTLAENGAVALELIENNNFDLILSDLQMPKVNGLQVLKASKAKDPNIEVLILTGYGSIKSAVRAMKSGAFEYLSKPVDIDELRLKVEQALLHRKMKIKIEQQQAELEAYHTMLERDLKLAQQVQKSLVPQAIQNERVNIGIKHLPMIDVGGDFADIYYDSHRWLYLTLVDVTGHGITAALLVNRVCSELRKLVREGLAPNEILFYLNNFIIDIFYRAGMFLTMCSCKIDLEEMTCTYSGSAHPAILMWHKKTGKLEELSSQNTIIGFQKLALNEFIQDTIPLAPGDKITLFTDGIIDIEKEPKKPLGLSGFKNALKSHIHLPPTDVPEAILADLDAHASGHIRDDIFFIVAELL
ncbi:SpoIIE family protein phosphatase [candidate division KSB1 bacterium]|nr:SpoIIE family protein phosphatase [candidate division KSB1 bacterium]